MKVTFGDWMKQVDSLVQKKIGLSVYDLPDQPFSDWYEDGVAVKSAAARVVRSAREEF